MLHLSRSPLVPPGLSTRKCGTAQSAIHRLVWSASQHLTRPGPPAAALPRVLSAWLLVSTLPTSLDEYFFNSLLVGLLYSSIFWQFWLVFVIKFVVILLLVVQGDEVYLPTRMIHFQEQS